MRRPQAVTATATEAPTCTAPALALAAAATASPVVSIAPNDASLAEDVSQIAPSAPSAEPISEALTARMHAATTQGELDQVAGEIGQLVQQGKVSAGERATLLTVYEVVAKRWAAGAASGAATVAA